MGVQGRVLAQNRRARFEYEILKTYEVGIELKGTEVKSIREGKINLSESYCRVTELMEGWLMQCNIYLRMILETDTTMTQCVHEDCFSTRLSFVDCTVKFVRLDLRLFP